MIKKTWNNSEVGKCTKSWKKIDNSFKKKDARGQAWANYGTGTI